MLNFLKQLRGKRATNAAKPPRWLRAHYRAAETTKQTADWWRADNLAADADANPDTRRILRMRSRYEIQNNAYARGVVQAIANDSIVSGPRLRFGSDDDELNTRVERDFTAWAEMTRLATKFRTIRIARASDGEAFVILAQNPALPGPVKLDLQLVDADRVTGDGPCGMAATEDVDRGEPLGEKITVDGSSRSRSRSSRFASCITGRTSSRSISRAEPPSSTTSNSRPGPPKRRFARRSRSSTTRWSSSSSRASAMRRCSSRPAKLEFTHFLGSPGWRVKKGRQPPAVFR